MVYIELLSLFILKLKSLDMWAVGVPNLAPFINVYDDSLFSILGKWY